MLTKEKIKITIENLPDQFTIDQLIEQLILIDKIEKANRQSENGNIISDEELDMKIEKWFG